LYGVNIVVRYQAPGSTATFYHAATDTPADKPETVTRKPGRQQRKHYLSAEVRAKYPDFPFVEGKRDRLKQRDKPSPQQQSKKSAAERRTAKLQKPSSTNAVGDELQRTGSAEEKMDVV